MDLTTKNVVIKLIYTFFLALLIALFYGLGISAFYPTPKAPVYPTVENTTAVEKDSAKVEEPAEVKAARLKYESDQKKYQEDSASYNRNVSIIALVLAVITLVASLFLMHKILFISDGLMLGGLFTLGYSVIRGFMSEDARYRFVVVAIGLIVTLALGYIKFIKTEEK